MQKNVVSLWAKIRIYYLNPEKIVRDTKPNKQWIGIIVQETTGCLVLFNCVSWRSQHRVYMNYVVERRVQSFWEMMAIAADIKQRRGYEAGLRMFFFYIRQNVFRNFRNKDFLKIVFFRIGRRLDSRKFILPKNIFENAVMVL